MTYQLARLASMGREIEHISNAHRTNVHYIAKDNHAAEIYSFPDRKKYIPNKTGLQFHSDDSFIKLIIGPYNSGKTTICLQEIIKRANAMPAWFRGRRKSRWAIIRNTVGELYSTTLKSWQNWFSDLGSIQKRQKPILTYEHTYNDGNGIVELEILFLALDREEDIRKIKSFEVTGAYLNELSEIPQSALAHFKGRVNHRYPAIPDDYWSGIICDTNPPDIDHWIYKDFELNQYDNYRIIHQPPGLYKDENDNWQMNKLCDNYVHMAKDYYLKLAEGQNEDFVKVYCLGEYGLVGHGKPVYPDYKDDMHSVDELKAIQGEPIYLAWDFGLTPACIVVQFTPWGSIHALKEYTADNMGIQTFAESIVIPSIKRDFVYNKIAFPTVADPAGIKRDEITATLSCIGLLNDIGIETHAARTNSISPRLSAVRFFLNRNPSGNIGFILSRKGCPLLRKGFIRDYCYKRVSIAGEERYREEPHKTHPVSDIHDCLQYIAMEFAADSILNEKAAKNDPVDMFNPICRTF